MPRRRDTRPPTTGPEPSAAKAAAREQDARLVRAALRGDQEAYSELVGRYMNIVVGFSYNRVGDFHRAEDIAQEAFLKAYNSLGSLQEPVKFGSWLLVIARHTCMDWLRANRPAVSLDQLRDAGHEPESPPTPEGFEAVSDAELEDRVLKAVHELREDYRDIIVMKHIDDLSYKEIGRLLGMSVSAVGEKLSRVRQILRKQLSKTVKGIASRE